jgi:DNA-directed RNA polymerase sigma subunit (sigma70/sigma32)
MKYYIPVPMTSKYPTSLPGIHLKKQTQLAIAKSLILGKSRLYTILLAIPQCVDILMQEYKEAGQGKRGNARIGALSKLSLHYNASVKGRNKKAGEQVAENMGQALEVATKDHRLATESIISAELHPKLYFSKKMRDTARHYSKRAQTLYSGIDRRRERLVMAVAGEIEEIAERHYKELVGEVLAYEDIAQEAALLAYQYTLIYDPAKGAHPTKWSTFAFSMIDKALRNYVAEKTRNIQIPRTIQDRYRIIKRVMDKTPTEDRKVLAALGNKSIIDKRGGIKEIEVFTEEEVDSLLSTVSNSIVSLDTPVVDGDDGSRALFEAIGSGLPNSEEIISYEETLITLRRKLRETLEAEETELVFLRYGLDRTGRSRTINEVMADCSVNRSKQSLAAMLERAELKLQESKAEFETVKRQVYEGCERKG